MKATLYRTRNNTTRIWTIWREGCILHITHGAHNGTQQSDIIEHPTPEAAEADLDSRVHVKMAREGYSDDPNADPPGYPMLLHNYREHGHKLDRRVYVQPKLDGYRCVANNKLMLSRRHDLITSMPHIQEELQLLKNGVTLDGELYKHGLPLQAHGEAIRSHEPVSWHKEIKYHVFDIQMEGTFQERYLHLSKLINPAVFNHVILVETINIRKWQVDKYLDLFTAAGYEGAIVRDPNGIYETDRRTHKALKLKPIFRRWFRIVDIVASDKGREKDAAIFECSIDDNINFLEARKDKYYYRSKLFRCRLADPIETRKWLYTNKEAMIGGIALIEFSDYTEGKIPQHPRCVKYQSGGNLENKNNQIQGPT